MVQCLGTFAATAQAQRTTAGETVYVSDVLYVTVRGGQTQEHRILHRGLPSGTKLTRLEHNSTSGYSLVRLENGIEGWVLSQYLSTEPIARDLLETTSKELLALKATHQDTRQSLEDIRQSRQQLQQTEASLRTEIQQLGADLTHITSLSENVLAIDKENQQLKETRESLNNKVTQLESERDELQDNILLWWFLIGSATVLISLLIGFFTARTIYNRLNRRRWR